MKKILAQLAVSSLILVSANCSGKTYSTFFQPFDLIFNGGGNSANPSDPVTLLAATPLTPTRVMLTFDEPVTLTTAQIAGNYSVVAANGIAVAVLSAVRDPNNTSVVYIDTTPQIAGTVYTVTVSNVTGVDGSVLSSSQRTATFTALNNADQSGPTIASAAVTTSTTVDVYFNEALTPSTVTAGANYRFYASLAACQADTTFSAGTVATSGTGDLTNTSHVTVTRSAMTVGTTYVLGARNVRDFWGNSAATPTCSAAFVYNAPTPRVSSAVSGSPTSLLVTFDQSMATAGLTTAGNYTFSSCGARTNATGATLTAFNNNTQVLLTGLTVGTAGTCQVTVNVAITSALGAALTANTNFAFFSYSTSDSTPPVVANAVATNSTTVRVTFSEPINAGTVGVSDFSFSPALSVAGVSCPSPFTYCDVTTSAQTTQSYNVTVSGINDAAGVALTGSTTSFTGDGKPYIVAIIPLDPENILVQWSETISAIQNGDYTTPNGISPAVNVNSVTFYPTPGTASPYVKVNISSLTPLTSGSTYTFSLPTSPATTDTTGNNATTTVSGGISFTGPSTTVPPTIGVSGVTELSPTTLRVVFNEPVDNSTLTLTNFVLGNTAGCPTPLSGNPTAAVQVSAGVVLLTVGSGVGANPCPIDISGVKDLLGNTMNANTYNYSYTGTGGAGDTTPPSILSVVSLSSTQIQVFFSEPMNTSGTVTIAMNNTANYSLSGGLTIGSLGTCTGSSCIINTSAQTAATYTLTVGTGIRDTTGNATTSDLTASFTGTPGSSARPTLFLANLVNSTTVELNFSEAMDLTTSECTSTGTCAAKYTVTGANSVSAAVRQADPTKVRLTLSPGAYGSSNSYTVTGDMTVLTDVAGNLLTTPNTATFNGSATSPAITDLAASSDSGSSNSDNITGSGIFPAPGLVFTGTVAPNTTVTLYDNGIPIATVVSDGTGAYSVTITTQPADGTHNYTIATVGPTGLVSDTSTPLSVTIDTTAPAQPTALDLVAGSDSGISATDNTTNSATPSFTVNCDVGSTVILRNGTTDITNPAGGVNCGASPVTVTASTLAAGTYASINVIQVDAAGNTSTASTNLTPSLVVDTTAPSLNSSTLAVTNTYVDIVLSEAAYGSATANTAVLLAAFNATFAANGGNATGITVQGIKRNDNTSFAAATALSGGETTIRFFFTVTGLASGTETITIDTVANSLFDAAGNAATFSTGAKTFNVAGIANITGTPTYTSTGATTGYITINWDEGVYTTAGAGALVAGDFTVTFTQNSGNATGASVTGIQNGVGGAISPGDTTIRVLISTTGATSGVETIRLNAGTSEIFSLSGTATPNTENTGTLTFPDTLAPNAPASLALASADDSGSSNSDRITSQTTGLTISGTAEANSTVRLYQPNTAGTLLGTFTADALGNWSGDIALAAGSTYTVVATARDAALNVSVASTALTITVDNTNPAATGTPDLTSGTDSGSSNSDDITSNTTPSFTISCENGATVQLRDGVTNTGTAGTCSGGTVTLTAATLTSGAHNINAIQTDPAGNTSVASGNLSVTIDTTAPAAPGAPDLTSGTDSGSSNSDNITNNTTPSFTVSCENGASVQLYDGVTATGTAGTCAGGTVTLTAAALSSGTHASMNAIQTDPAGNVSTASGNLSITIDNTAPAATGTPDLVDASDTGATNSDNITTDTTPTFTVTCENGASVQLYDNATPTGTAVTCASGTATLTAAALSVGTHASMNAIQTDAAGNASAASGNLSITIDTSNPAAPGTPDMTSGTDSGSSNSDNITNNTTPSFTVSCENGASVQLYDNVTATGTAGTCAGGTVTLTAATLSSGVHASMNAIQTDPAGNVSTASGNLSITIDNTAPAATGTPDMTSGTDSGSSNTDNYTSNTTPSFTVSCETGASVQLYDGVTATGTAGTCAGGTVTLTAAALSAGVHASMNAIQTDPAGNASAASTNLSVTIDTSVAAPGAPDMTSATDAGVSNTDNITNTTTPSFTVSCEDGASVQLYDNATPTGTAGTCASSTVTLTSAALSAGVHASMNAIQTDLAGNVSTASGNLSITIDTTVPTISSVAPATAANVNNTLVSYTYSEVCGTATITWTRTGGAADSNHNQSLTGSELTAGAHMNITITNNPTLVDTSIYTVSWNCTDVAGNAATTVSSTGVTFNSVPIAITSAETMDTDNDGKIDTYRVAFNKNVNDSTFPGYSANALGSVTANWLIAGYTNVRLIHGSAVTFATDTINDAVIYIRFDENALVCSAASQVGCDTGAKPDLTTTATPGLQDLGATTISQVNTGSVTEADGAKPTLIAARSLSSTTADAIFSEAVQTTTSQTASNYVITGGTNPTVSAAVRDGTNTNIVHLTTGTQTGGVTYTLTVNTNVTDLVNFNLNSSANTATFDGVVKPVVSSIVTTSATTLTITFNESVTAATTECTNLATCSAIYTNVSLPVISAVSTGGTGVNSATYTLTVNPMVQGQSYTTTVTQDTVTSVATGQKMGSTNNSATFTGDGRPAVNISSDNATECPGNGPQRRVVVQYDQAVLTGGGANAADNPANYSIPNTTTDTPQGCVDSAQPCATGTNQTATSVTSYGGNKFGINFTTAFDSDASQYVLKVVNVRDTTTNSVAVPTNLTFQCGNDTTAPSLIGVTVVSATAGSTVLLLTFSESVATVQANTTTNYRYDTAAYGANVNTAAIQSNTAQVQVTFVPALSNGGHQLRTINQRDLATPTPNTILDNGVNNVQPFIVNAPTGFAGGPVFTDPFADGTPAGQMVIYDNKIILGWDTTSSKFFEMDKGLTTAQTITLDADGTATAPYTQFGSYASGSSGTLQGLDAISAGCVGGSSTPSMTGTACSGASGTEYIFAGGFNTSGNYRSVFRSTDKSSSVPRFTFTERGGLDASGNTYRSMTATVFKNYLFVASPHIGSFAPRTSRVCALPSGACGNGETSWNTPTAIEGRFFPTIGKQGNLPNSTGVSNPKGNAVAIDTMFEYDTDGTSGTSCSGASCPSQLYMANGGRFFGTLGASTARTSTTRFDGGVIRSHPDFSTAAAPPGCAGATANDCETLRFENITPSSADWLNYMSIPLPYLTISGADWANMLPSNRIIPAMKAVPYMRAAPNGDLYMIRNACATLRMQTVCMVSGSCNGGAGNALVDADIPNSFTVAQTVNDNFTADFATTANGRRQVCPPGYEVPQLWVLPKSTGGTRNGSAQWQLVASRTFTPQTFPNGSALPARKSTTLSGNTTTCGTAPNNKCERNAHVTLLEFVGNYLYIGFDNQDHGANIWRVDMNSATCTGSASCALSGNYPAEASFTIVNDVLGLDGSATNQRIFSHLTVNDSGKDWLILATRDGTNSMKIYRTANDQN